MFWLKSIFNIAGALSDAYRAREEAKTDRDRMMWDQRAKQLEARQEVILQAQKDPYERWVRIGFAFPFVVYINKLVLWDKVFALGKTDPLSAELTNIMMIVIGGYFVDTVVRRVMRR